MVPLGEHWALSMVSEAGDHPVLLMLVSSKTVQQQLHPKKEDQKL